MKKSIDLAAPLRVLIGLLFFLIISLTCLQVITRYAFNFSLIWSEELVRFLVIWMCMISAPVLSYDDSHMVINSLVQRLPVALQFILYTLRQILICVFSVWSAIGSFRLLKAAAGTYSGALNISFALWRGAGTVGLLLVAVFTCLRYAHDFSRFRHGKFWLGEPLEKKGDDL